VMDYPSPYVKITNGKLDLSEAYTTGIGPYDEWVIRYVYVQFPPGTNERAELEAMVRQGPLYVTDSESRPAGSAHPQSSLWDAPGDPIEMLRHDIEVRRIALSQFGLRNIGVGTPLAQLEELLVPLYLHHRYQLEAAAKSIGGLDYTYTVKENGALVPQPIRRIVPAARQREALSLVLSTLEPSFLKIPQRIVDLIPPRGDVAVTSNTELFDHATAPLFDPISAAVSSVEITLDALLSPQRAARMDEFHAEDSQNPGFNEALGGIVRIVTHPGDGIDGAITRAAAWATTTRLMALADDEDASAQVRADAAEGLRGISARLTNASAEPAEVAHRHALREAIEQFLSRPGQTRTQPKPPSVPPGMPIGD